MASGISEAPAERIEVARERHGPFERIVLSAAGRDHPVSLSVYRVGDLLIDTGGTRVAEALVEALRERPPARILCTHQHEDHVGGVGALRRAFGPLPVHVAAPYVELLTAFDRVPAYRAAAWGTPEPIADAIGFLPGAEFEAGGITLRALETPGHTPFHITFVTHTRDGVYALTGDLYTSTPQLAWFEASAEDLVRSCRLVASESSELQMLPTHGKARVQGAELLRKLADTATRQADAVHAAHSPGDTRGFAEIARALYGDADAERARISEGEFTHANFVRAVLAPVKTLPAAPAR